MKTEALPDAVRPVASNAVANRQARNADTTTPLAPAVPPQIAAAATGLLDTDTGELRDAPPPTIVLSFTVIHRGRQITISTSDMRLDAFCDMLDKKFGVLV